MSAASDVLEMKDLCIQIADRTARSNHLGDRISAIMAAVGVGANRAYEFLRGKALRVDSWEKDVAREAIAKLELERERIENARFIERLGRELAYLQTSDPDLHQPEIEALERTLARMGFPARALAVPSEELATRSQHGDGGL